MYRSVELKRKRVRLPGQPTYDVHQTWTARSRASKAGKSRVCTIYIYTCMYIVPPLHVTCHCRLRTMFVLQFDQIFVAHEYTCTYGV